MARVSLIGPGDVDFHFSNLLGIKKSEFESELEGIANSLVNSGSEIELLPDKGVCFQIAEIYKKLGGKKVIGAVPKSDKTFGIEHLKKYIDTEVERERLFEEIIDSGDWFKHDLIKGLLGDVVLCLGKSPGTNGELNYAVYLYKLMRKFKEGVEISGKIIHPEIRAGNNYSVIVYSPFIKNGKLAEEDEAYIKKFGIGLHYVNSSKELEEFLQTFN